MRDKIEYKGYWWLPSNSVTTVAGILTYIPHERITLELIGSFDSEKKTLEAFLNKKTENIIHGFTSDSKEITLVDCDPSGNVNLSCSFPIIRYSCQFIIIGKHLQSLEQKSFYKALITIPELMHWRPPESLNTSIQFSKENRKKLVTISFEIGEKIVNSTQINDNTQLIIKEGINYYGDHFSPKIEQQTYLEILKESNASIEDFYSDVSMYEQFLSLATLQTVKCSQILLYDKTVFQELSCGEKYYHSIEIIYIQRFNNESLESKKHNFLFDYNSIASQYTQAVRKWYANKDNIAPIRTHLIDSIKNKDFFSSVDFLIVIQAIEGFWWRFRDDNYRKNNQIPAQKKTELKTIINELIKEFDSIHKIKTLDLDIKSVVDSRHYYSHFMNKTEKPHTLDGVELYNLTSKIRKILICCVLHFIGFDYPQINQILNGSHNSLLTSS